jgi:hypothetical protein
VTERQGNSIERDEVRRMHRDEVVAIVMMQERLRRVKTRVYLRKNLFSKSHQHGRQVMKRMQYGT